MVRLRAGVWPDEGNGSVMSEDQPIVRLRAGGGSDGKVAGSGGGIVAGFRGSGCIEGDERRTRDSLSCGATTAGGGVAVPSSSSLSSTSSASPSSSWK